VGFFYTLNNNIEKSHTDKKFQALDSVKNYQV